MSAWAVLVLLTSGALASMCWCAARCIVHLATLRRTGAGAFPRRPGARRGRLAAYAATATGVGVASGHPFAGAAFLVPALAIDYLCARLWGGSSAGRVAATAAAPARAAEPDDDRALCASWDEASSLGLDETVVQIARERCDGLLRAQGADPFELAMLEWAVFVKRRVPDLIAACRDVLGLCRDEAPRAALLDEMSGTLEKIGLEADRRRDLGRAIAHHRFEIARDHALQRIDEARSRP